MISIFEQKIQFYLKSEYKGSSYELLYDETTGFKMTGERVPFDELAKPRLFKPVANREAEKALAIELKKEGKGNSEITKALKKKV